MDKALQNLRWAAWVALVPLVGFFAWHSFSRLHPPLPIYGQVPDFVLTNQLGSQVTLASLKGKVWVVDTFFTRCPSQCVQMTYEMGQLQKVIGSSVMLVSLTTDPKYDKPAVLKKHAQKIGAKENWIFLTGDKQVINHIAIDGLKLSIVENTPGEDEDPNNIFIHSTKFVLIDKKGQIRGYYIGETGEQRPQLLADIKRLLKE